MKRVSQNLPKETVRLTNSRSCKIEEFTLYKDKEIGFEGDWDSGELIETRHDDDVDTDEEVFSNAKLSITADFRRAVKKLRDNKFEWDDLIFNSDIDQRIKMPH